ncbi:hypothetical protein [Flavilitoribacter nigricans]|uniref:Uncharacterized protein n=1 Tax=Flavilitoribacter nigricans (strain ATCC 23147 / DSM 23189 / NBRC 102662 / NCIMB 1420 / SS-2) TaxID=1122177 RepID=A0A2D0MWT6_FLAN2|nr:hypothetical protein [Flavilitoribacter nigricans]PHN00724.1 hypothetical protein CRP01_40790 [Flavilitoribacter nigricans DSM 23189 = NBRC 102662]
MSNKQPLAKSSHPSTADSDWLEYAQKEQQQAPKHVEETAKYLAAVISISLTIFLGQSSDEIVSDAKEFLDWGALLWGISAVISFFVFFPWAYHYNPQSPDSIRKTYSRITRIKRWLLIAAVLCYLTALGFGILGFLNR